MPHSLSLSPCRGLSFYICRSASVTSKVSYLFSVALASNSKFPDDLRDNVHPLAENKVAATGFVELLKASILLKLDDTARSQ